jgi:hypothetical protein
LQRCFVKLLNGGSIRRGQLPTGFEQFGNARSGRCRLGAQALTDHQQNARKRKESDPRYGPSARHGFTSFFP